MKYEEDAVNFIRDIKPKDETVIISHNDGDGVCSATIIKKLLERMGLRKPYIISQPMPMEKNLVNRVKTTAPTKIIFLDLVVDQQEEIAKKLRGFADILVIDHHKINKNLNSKQTGASRIRNTPVLVYYNPRYTKPSIYQSASYCAYKIASKIADVSDILWVAAVGMVSDYNLEDSQDLLNEIRAKYKIDKLYESFIGEIADMIWAARAANILSCEEIVELFASLDSPGQLEQTEKGRMMAEANKKIKGEIASAVEDIKNGAERVGNVIFYSMKSEYNIGSPVSTKASEACRDKLLIVYNKAGTKYKVSARNQNKNIDAGKVMSKACEGLKASGGGHEAAAGATVDEKDWEKFKENILSLVNRSKN